MEKKILHVCLTFLILSSCAKIRDHPQMINFYAKYAEPAVKASFSSFTIGYSALILAYASGSISNILTGTPLNATTQNGGNLNPVTPLILPKGYYDFYSTSINSPNPMNISFTNGISQELSNGVDYLWAGSKGVLVNNGANVSFTYYHLACLINISISTNGNVSNLSLNYVNFRFPSTNGVVMNLAEGTVNPATSVSSYTIVPGSGNTRSIICLPSIAQTQIEVSLNATIDGDAVNNRIYSTIINQPFVSGSSYDIVLYLNTDNSFGVSVNVSQWQNEYGTITY